MTFGQKHACWDVLLLLLSYVSDLKMFSCRRVVAYYKSRGFSDLDQVSPGPTGLEPQQGPLAHLLVWVY